MLGFVFVALYAATIPLANWMIGNVGTTCVPNGPCLIPVGFGLMAPSGLMVAALALVFRDLVQLTMGLRWSLGAIALGAAISSLFAPSSLVFASVSAFVISELIDTAVYTPLQRRNLTLAVIASSVVGIVIDSLIFLWIAFGSLDYLLGQIVGKGWTILIAVVLIHFARHILLNREVRR